MSTFSHRASCQHRGDRRAWPLRTLKRLAADGRSEDGVLLIEVMVSALLVALIAVGTFTGIDVSNRLSRDQRSRSQAVTLAQADEERLRSLGSAQLANLSEEKVVTFQNVKYTVKSSSEFVSDTSGAGSCSASSANADYYSTVSEVKWPNMGPRPPIVQTGLVEPPAGGELTVQVEDFRGGKVAGMTITGTGPASLSGTTSSKGCVVFGPLEEGTYSINAKQTGYVSLNGESEVPVASRSVTLTGQTTSGKTFVFNLAGTIVAKLKTAPAALGGAQALNVVAANSSMSAARLLLTNPVSYSTGPISSPTSPATFFPFNKGGGGEYEVYAGTCEANLPTAYGGPSQPLGLEPGATATREVTEPGMIVLMRKGSVKTEALITKPEVWIKDTGCKGEYKQLATEAAPTAAKGDLTNPGLPYGKYNVCIVFKNKSNETKYNYKEGVENKNTTTGETVELFETGQKGSATAGSLPGGCP